MTQVLLNLEEQKHTAKVGTGIEPFIISRKIILYTHHS